PLPPAGAADPLLQRALAAREPATQPPDGPGAGEILREAVGAVSCLTLRVGAAEAAAGAILVADGGGRLWDDADARTLGDIAALAAATLAGAPDAAADAAAERALRDAEARWLELAEDVDAIVFRANASLGFTYLSGAWRASMGFKAADALGSSAVSYVHPEDRPRAIEALLGLLEEREDAVEFDARWLARTGERRMRVRARAARDAAGGVSGIAGTLADHTERAALEEQLRQSQKFEAVGRLAGGVAHDFNNLLTAIRGYADLLLADLPADDARRDDAAEIRRLTERAGGLTRHLLAFSRSQVLPPADLDLAAVVEDMRERLGEALGPGVELSVQPGPARGAVRVDREQAERVLVLLAERARESMPEGGRVTVETFTVALRERYADDQIVLAPGRYLGLAVGDTGPAAGATRERMFDPLHGTPGAERGLGLATVYGIVKQGGGHVWAYDEPGVGATFKIYLPSSDAPAPRPSPPKGLPQGDAGTVLLVEDDDQLRAVARRTLASRGYSVLEAPHGRAALDLVAEHEGRIDILVTDVVMPVMAGRELADKLQVARPGIRVLYMSGFSDGDIVQRGLLGSHEGFLQKPFAPDTLVHRIRALLEG
ncbi:MAG: response regulator, partial [Gemmatimonadaceae bacterium]